MDFAHRCIGAMGVIALFVLLTQVTTRVVVNATPRISKLIKDGAATMQFDQIHQACGVVKNSGHCLYDIVEMFACGSVK